MAKHWNTCTDQTMNDMVRDDQFKHHWPKDEGPDEAEIQRLIDWYDSLDQYALQNALDTKEEWLP